MHLAVTQTSSRPWHRCQTSRIEIPDRYRDLRYKLAKNNANIHQREVLSLLKALGFNEERTKTRFVFHHSIVPKLSLHVPHTRGGGSCGWFVIVDKYLKSIGI